MRTSLQCEPLVKGWVEKAGLKAKDVLDRLKDVPFGEVIYTEISRDGTFEGIDAEGLERMIGVSPRPVIASGGVADAEDVRKAAGKGAWAVIIGKALYDGRLSLEDAIAAGEGA